MFPRRNRLSRDEIAEVTKSGRVVRTPLLSVRVLDNPTNGRGLYKFAFVISKKESKTAVSRNRAKRRVRAAMRRVLPQQSKPLYCIIFIKKEVLDASIDDIVLNLTKALK